MSSTNRGTKRRKDDFYETPLPVVKNFLYHHTLQPGTILVPCAGSGNFIKAIREHGYRYPITAVEIRGEMDNLAHSGANAIYIRDYRNFEPTTTPRTIISNPPYSLAREIIKKSLEIAGDNTEVIMLLRLAFLESKGRFTFWQKNPPSKLYVLSNRPSFTGSGTDSTAYAWFVWGGEGNGEVKVIWGK